MKHYQFKTNINCSGCIAKVTPHLNETEQICHWNVDTSNPVKMLSVATESLDENAIIKLVEKAGFKAEKL